MNREKWLQNATDIMRSGLFKQHGFLIPEDVKISCGFPPTGGTARKMTVGVCFPRSASNAKINEIFINPTRSEMISTAENNHSGVLGTLVHELVHAVDDCQHGHKKPFKDIATRVGLTGKMTATGESEELDKYFKDEIISKLGDYPHANIEVSQRKQTTRMFKVECNACGFSYRTSRKMIERISNHTCNACGEDSIEVV